MDVRIIYVILSELLITYSLGISVHRCPPPLQPTLGGSCGEREELERCAVENEERRRMERREGSRTKGPAWLTRT